MYVTYRVPVEVELEIETGEIINVHIMDEKLEGPIGSRLKGQALQLVEEAEWPLQLLVHDVDVDDLAGLDLQLHLNGHPVCHVHDHHGLLWRRPQASLEGVSQRSDAGTIMTVEMGRSCKECWDDHAS